MPSQKRRKFGYMSLVFFLFYFYAVEVHPTEETSPQLNNELKGKAKSDGEDVLPPLLQQTANIVLTEVGTKK